MEQGFGDIIVCISYGLKRDCNGNSLDPYITVTGTEEIKRCHGWVARMSVDGILLTCEFTRRLIVEGFQLSGLVCFFWAATATLLEHMPQALVNTLYGPQPYTQKARALKT